MSLPEFLILIVLGLAAGSLGGLLGIGGSILMIPVLTLVLRHDQHVSQAAAMIVNVFVAVPGVFRHHLARAIEWRVVRRMIPAGLVFILVGVALSNTLDGPLLGTVFGVFLLTYLVGARVLGLLRPGSPVEDAPPRAGWLHTGGVGAIAGLAAGLLGIGGGVIAVPLLNLVCRLPLRRAIAASATMMCVTSVFGAAAKNATLPSLDLDVTQSLLIAACLVPTAIAGGLYGAGLTHRLPLGWVRLVLHVLLLVAAIKFLRVI
ncbi:MAG: sulfite exporter TauE/SafE family protein [Planctomycetes bacterium]|nr:sulfite exporter TauE/SafE family protein [Planctomycetota bacterium]